MASFQATGAARDPNAGASGGPLVALFERDDAIAVPLLSQVRLAGYDVRAARTAVELFDVLAKQPVTIVLVDLGTATAGRREFWVALDARRRGRPLQVMTFRVKAPGVELDTDVESTAQALADVEVAGPLEFSLIVEGVRARVPLHGAAPAPIAGTLPPGMNALPPGASQQFGMALGAMSSLVPAYSGGPFPPFPSQFSQAPGVSTIFGPPSVAAWDASPFNQPAEANPFTGGAGDASPFAQPYNSNPFGNSNGGAPAGGPPPGGLPPWQANDPDMNPFGLRPSPGPFGGSGPGNPGFGNPGFGNPGFGGQSGPHGGFGGSGPSQPGAFSASQPSGSSPRSPARPSIADSWAPPDAGQDQQETGVVPRLADRPISATGDFAALRGSDAFQRPHVPEKWGAPAGRPLAPADEQALSNVLVEGALLSPHTVEVLRGVQQMLGTVDMKLNIGELAMMFRFLSGDQYLAALLVSRGLVTPEQIASLGRLKQELAVAGLDYDLETLLVKYNMLAPDQLAQVRSEVGRR